MRILLIEDDRVLKEILQQSLIGQNYVVDAIDDGSMGLEYAQSTTYDTILTDVGLPGLDGISLCQQLRSEGYSSPILLMTAKDAIADRIKGLDAGADDYLIKPIDLGELQARLRALGRRGQVLPSTVLEIGNLRLDPATCQATYEGKLLGLTPKEYTLLELLLRNPARVFSRSQIIEHLWTFDDPPLEDSVKAHIKGLRQKLKKAGALDWIENVYGIGYRLNPPKSDSTKVKQSPKSESVEQQFDRAMVGLWEQYRGLMLDRLKVLQQASVAVQAQTISEQLRQAAKQAAHKLAGVLGMFDRDSGTIVARQIEDLLAEEGSKADRIGQLPALVEELAKLLNLTQNNSINLSIDRKNIQKKLMLIDRDPKLASELQQLAQSVGVQWYCAESIETARLLLQTALPDLVVMEIDRQERWENSLALIEELAARTPSIPVLVITAADNLVDRVAIAGSGGSGVLVKPVTAEYVWEVTARLLQRSHDRVTRVLVVDDDPIFLAALQPILEPWGIRLTSLEDPRRFWQVLKETEPDLLILDVEMPYLNGIELCQAVRIDPIWQSLPILFLTARREPEIIQQVFAAGADDYIPKPIIGSELLTRINNRLERIRLLQTLATKDPLTGLANQAQSEKRLAQMRQIAEQNSQFFCLALFIVELRQIKRQYGRAASDRVLQKWGDLFRSTFRGAEIVGYWGDGEFVVAMPELTKEQGSDRLADILKSLRRQIFDTSDGRRFQVDYCYYLAEYPTDGLTIDALYSFIAKSCQEI